MERAFRKCLFIIAVLVKRMIGYKGEKPFCDLQCRICDGWEMKPCLFSGMFHMRMLMARCLGKGVLLEKAFQAIGLWKKNLVLDCRELGVTPPSYRETEH
jgi:hypothetical protein